MKNFTHWFKWIFFVLVLMLIFTTKVFSQLSGTYTIGGTTPDYTTIKGAVDDLVAQGVSGPCIFNIRDGDYFEQVTVGEISGVSHTNTAVFQSEALNPDNVLIYHASVESSDNWVVKFDSCDYVTFQYLEISNGGGTYSRVIDVGYESFTCTNNSILNNRIIGLTSTSTNTRNALIYSYQEIIDSLTIEGNELIGGSYSIYLRGNGTVSEDVLIKDNTTDSYRGLYLEDQDKVNVIDNTLENTNYRGLDLLNCDLDIVITGNKIHTSAISSCTAFYMTTCVGSALFKGLISNNYLLADGSTTGTNYSFYYNNSSFQQFYNNTLHVEEGSINGACLFAHSGSNLSIRNNNMVNSALGYTIIENTTNTINECDYNNLYTNGNYFAKWDNNVIAYDLVELQAIDLNTSSYSVYPGFIAVDDFHVNTDWLNNKGTTLGEVSVDLDGETRGVSPDIGADEFTPDNTMTYSGSLSINSAGGGDFYSFTEAIDSLKKLGVSGPVTIDVDNDTYTEQLSIPDIPGVDATNTITFQSTTGDSTDVTLRYASTDQNINYVVELRGADYITFREMTISGTGAQYGRVFELKGYAHNNTIENNVLNGSGTQNNTKDRTIIYTYKQKTEGFSIINNVYNNGSRGIYLEGISTTIHTAGLLIQNNEFNDHYRNINILHQTNFEISDNSFQNFTDAGIGLYRCQNPFTVKNNTLTSTISDDEAMYISECYANGSDEGQTYNNFIHLNNAGSIYGIYINSSPYQSIYYNSVNVLSNDNSTRAFYNNAGTDLIVKNNIFCSYGSGGTAYYNTNATGITTSDHNNLYSLGTYLGRWGTVDCQTLGDFQTESGMDGNSLNIDPAYTSETDLHTNSPFIDSTGTPIAGITDDIDGEARDGVNPDIGADEYTSTLTPLSGPYTIGTTGDFTDFTQAIDTLVINGISGPVLFNVQSDTYNEHFIIPQISGIFATDTVVFQSLSGNPANVIISYTAPDADNNYIAKLDGADYITFKDMTFQTGTSQYGNLIVMSGNAHDNKFIGNIFEGRSQSTSGTEDACIIMSNNPISNNTLVKDNEFNNGSYGLYFAGYTSVHTEDLIVSNNTFNPYYRSIYISYHDAPYIEGNTCTFKWNNGSGIHIQNCGSSASSGLVILKNQIYTDNPSTTGGIYLNNSDASGSFPGLIANNIVRISNNSGGSAYGIYIHGSDEQNIYYNSVNISSSTTGSRALYINNSNSIDVQNNNISIRGELYTLYSGHGYAFYVNGSTLGTSNHNNFYSPNRYLIYYSGTNYETLNDFSAVSSTDANSVSYFPAFLDLNDLHTNSSWTDDKGTHIALVTEDIEGNPRDGSNPDIGAYEYTTTQTPLSGTYTVGASGQFPDLDSVSTALHALGISDPVTFNLQSSTYFDVHLKFKDIPGADSQDTIVIQSQSGNPADVTLGYVQTEFENYMMFLNGTDHITFKDLTFSAGGVTYTRIFQFNGNSKHVKIVNNIFNGVSYTSGRVEMDLIHLQQDYIVDSILISGNTFNNSSYAIRVYGYSSYDANDVRIVNNTFNNQYIGMYLNGIKNIYVGGNEFHETQSRAIEALYCDDNIRIIGNKMQTAYDNYRAIYLNSCDGTALKKGLIANNFIQADGTGSDAYGIYVSSSTNQLVYYNSVNITGTNNGSAFRNQSGGSNLVKNNAFTNTGEGYAYYCNNTTGVSMSDNNNIYTTGSKYAYYNGSARADLGELQVASGKDASSLSVNPMFTSDTDLHLIGDSLIEKAIVLAEVTTDFDGETRDVSNPDMGADEFSCAFFPPPVVEDVTACSNDSIPALYADGSNIKWYSDAALITEVWSANEYDPGHTDAGVYTYYVTQTDIGCTSAADSVVLTILQAPELSADITQIDCQGTDYGAINLTVSGSTASPFSYLWSNDEIYEDIDDLEAGDYVVTVEDLNGCTEVDTFTVTEPTAIILDIITEDTECDTSFGSATVVATGGEEPYEYLWNTGDSVTVINDLYAGIYVVTVTDNRGCTEVGIATVSDIGAPTIAVDYIDSVSCYGVSDGGIYLTITGGVNPLEFEWSNGATTEDISGLAAGPYEIIVEDSIGCQAIESFEVEEPDPIKISLNINETSCGQSNGAAEAIVTGGTVATDYIYSWSTGESTSEITGLNKGVYDVDVTDDNGCTRIKYFSISEIGAPSVIVDSTLQGTCGNSDGAVYISVYGAYPTYTYDWSNGSTDEDLVGVNPGTYSVTVSDDGGCDAVQVATIEDDQPPVNPLCMVSVDSATNYNEVIWEKQYTTGVDYYRVYKESTQSGVYYEVGIVDVTAESVFVDTLSDVMQRSWRYKLAVVDDCGVESDLSEHHKTMHLTINLGINNTINLIWNHYEGFSYETYYIHRRSNSGWELLDSVPGNLNSYTDADPIEDENLYYMIEIKHPTGGCDPATKARRNSSRSNITNPVQAMPDNIAPTAPTSLATTAITDTTISLIWVSSTDNIEVTGYEVYKDGSLEAEVTDTVYKVIDLTHSTTYAFYVKAKDATENLSDASNTINPTTTTPVGIEIFTDNGIKHINLYPNPNKGEFRINIETTEKQEIWYEIYTINGVLVNNAYLGFILGEYEGKVDLSDQGDGMYIMKIYSKSGIHIERILLSK